MPAGRFPQDLTWRTRARKVGGMEMTGKVVVVTGASMGIGEAIAKRFLQEGAALVMTSRDLVRAEDARWRIGSAERTLAVACDVTVRAEIEALLHAALERFGRVDVWVNNAGSGLVDSVERMDMAACRRMFETNLFGAMEAMQVVAPYFKKQGTGAIVNIASVAGLISVPYMSAYSATKHALIAFSRAVRLELAPYGVQVNCVCPGYVRTDFSQNAVWGSDSLRVAGARQRGITAERTAEAVWRAYAQNLRVAVVPWHSRLLVLLSRTMPGVFDWGMLKMLRRMSRNQI